MLWASLSEMQIVSSAYDFFFAHEKFSSYIVGLMPSNTVQLKDRHEPLRWVAFKTVAAAMTRNGDCFLFLKIIAKWQMKLMSTFPLRAHTQNFTIWEPKLFTNVRWHERCKSISFIILTDPTVWLFSQFVESFYRTDKLLMEIGWSGPKVL